MERTIKSFLRGNVAVILLLAYFGRLAIPAGIGPFRLAGFFYLFTLPVVTAVLLGIGAWGCFGLVKSRIRRIAIHPKHKSFSSLAAFGFALLSLSFVSLYSYHHKRFDSVLWKDVEKSMQWDANLLTPRQRMTADLVENVLPGLVRGEIEALLGVPYESWRSEDGLWKILYVLGPERGFGVDAECLAIEFDEAAEFQNAETFGNCG